MAIKKKSYFVLGKRASIFWDSSTRLKVMSSEVPVPFEGRLSKRIELAIAAGHLVEVQEEQAKVMMAKADKKEAKTASDTAKSKPLDYRKMNKADLVEHLLASFEVEDDYLEDFKQKTKDEMIDALYELDE